MPTLIHLALRRTRPGIRRPFFARGNLVALPTQDIPAVESHALAASLPTEAMVSVVDGGKHVSRDEHSAHNVVQMNRPRKFVCLGGCGEPPTISIPNEVRGGEPKRYCPECAPRGILGVVQGGAGDVA